MALFHKSTYCFWVILLFTAFPAALPSSYGKASFTSDFLREITLDPSAHLLLPVSEYIWDPISSGLLLWLCH